MTVRWSIKVLPETATEKSLKLWCWQNYAIGKNANLGKEGWGWEALKGPKAETQFVGTCLGVFSTLGDAKVACLEDAELG